MRSWQLYIVGLCSISIATAYYALRPGARPLLPAQATQSPQEQAEPSEKTSLRLYHFAPQRSPVHKAALLFAKRAKADSRGAVNVTVYSSNDQPRADQIVRQLQEGSNDIIVCPVKFMSHLVGELQILNFPFLTRDRDHCYQLIDGSFGQSVLGRLESHGIKGLTFWDGGAYGILSLEEPTRENLLSARFQSLQPDPDHDRFLPWEVNSGPRPNSLLVGRVKELLSHSWAQQPVHFVPTEHGIETLIVAMNAGVFKSLDVDLRRIIGSSAQATRERQRQLQATREETLINSHPHVTLTPLPQETRRVLRQRSLLKVQPLTVSFDAGLLGMAEEVVDEISSLPNQEALVVGYNADLKLGSRVGGLSILRGLQLAASEINEAGGLLGKRLTLVARDHSGVPSRGLENLEYFASLTNLIGVVGAVHSPVSAAVLDRVHELEVPLLIPWASATQLTRNGYATNYVFRLAIPDSAASEFLIERATEESSRVALLLERTIWGRSCEGSLVAALARRKLNPAAICWFHWNETEYDQLLLQAERQGAEVIVLVAGSPEAAGFVHAMRTRTNRLPIYAHVNITTGNFWAQTRDSLEQVELRFIQSRAGDRERRLELYRHYLERFGSSIESEVEAAPSGFSNAYDLLNLFALAVKRAGSADRREIRRALEELDAYSGLIKEFEVPFRPDRHEALSAREIILCRFSSSGEIEPVAD